MTLFDIFPKNMPQPRVTGSAWYRGGEPDTFVLSLPADGVIVYHRHLWARVDDPHGGSYRCTYVYVDGAMCGTMWSHWGGAPMSEWGEKFFAAGGPYTPQETLPGNPDQLPRKE
jgi:hypothetical protein